MHPIYLMSQIIFDPHRTRNCPVLISFIDKSPREIFFKTFVGGKWWERCGQMAWLPFFNGTLSQAYTMDIWLHLPFSNNIFLVFDCHNLEFHSLYPSIHHWVQQKDVAKHKATHIQHCLDARLPKQTINWCVYRSIF